jgi:curved DNA-binding protein CbpA
VPEYDQTEKDAYDKLELPEGASQEAIKQRHRQLIRKLNPDNGSEPDEDEFEKVNKAYEDLTNPSRIAARQQAKCRAAAE